jgi:ABC-type nitrate/sulfonate/bicarbonate transport system substrate-binding protein
MAGHSGQMHIGFRSRPNFLRGSKISTGSCWPGKLLGKSKPPEHTALVVKSDSKIQSPGELSGKKIAVKAGFSPYTAAVSRVIRFWSARSMRPSTTRTLWCFF